MDLKELRNVLELAKEYGLKKLRLADGLEVEFGDKLVAVPIEEFKKIKTEGMPTEDEFLFMSSIPMTDDEIKAQPPV
jgi:hypothetical protein